MEETRTLTDLLAVLATRRFGMAVDFTACRALLRQRRLKGAHVVATEASFPCLAIQRQCVMYAGPAATASMPTSSYRTTT